MLNQLSLTTLFTSYSLTDGSLSGNVFSGFFIGALKGVVHIFVSIAVFYATFYITFYSADIFSSLFGIKDRGHDVQETVGSPVDSGSGRYSKSI